MRGGRLGVFCFSQENIIWSNLRYRCNGESGRTSPTGFLLSRSVVLGQTNGTPGRSLFFFSLLVLLTPPASLSPPRRYHSRRLRNIQSPARLTRGLNVRPAQLASQPVLRCPALALLRRAVHTAALRPALRHVPPPHPAPLRQQLPFNATEPPWSGRGSESRCEQEPGLLRPLVLCAPRRKVS